MTEEIKKAKKKPGVKPGNIESAEHRMNKGEAGRKASYYVKPDGSWNTDNKTVKEIVSNLSLDVKNMPFAPLREASASKLMSDGGKKLALADILLKLGQTRLRPQNDTELLERLYEYFAICQNQQLPPTYPLFCVWCGMSIETMEGTYSRTFNVTDTVKVCKETIRGFLELSAMDNTMSPLIYFHQQKVYFGAVETQKIQVESVATEAERLAEIEALVGSIQAPIEVENLAE